MLVPDCTEYPTEPRDAPAHQPLHVATAGVPSIVVVARPFPHCSRSCSPPSESWVKSTTTAFGGTADVAPELRSTKKKSCPDVSPAAAMVPESPITRLPSGVVMTKCERSSVEFVIFLTSIHSSSVDAFVPAHPISLIRSGRVVTNTVLSVEVAAVPFDLYATTANVVVADAVTLLVVVLAVVVASTMLSFMNP